MAGRPGRPPSGLVRSNPSPAATGTEGGTRRLFRRLRWRVVEPRAGVRFVAGNARLPVAHGIGRLRGVEGSRTNVRSYPVGGYALHNLPYPGVGAHDVREQPTKR